MLEESTVILAQPHTAPSGAAAVVMLWFKRRKKNYIYIYTSLKELDQYKRQKQASQNLFVTWFILDILKQQGCLLPTCWILSG